VTFSFNPAGGSASAGQTIRTSQGATLSIPNGSDTATYTVPVVDDLFFENTNTVVGRISNPSDAAINLSTSVVVVSANITDNDNPVGGISADLTVYTTWF
jgi:hypothetical protein